MLDSGKQVIVTRPLKVYDEMLVPAGFFRIHQSHLVNLSRVDEYIRGEGGQVKLANGEVLEVSRRRKLDLLAALSG